MNNYNKIKKQKQQEYRKKWSQQNKEKILQYKKTYREKNKQKLLQKDKEYRTLNKNKILETKRKYRENNQEKIKEFSKIYTKNNKEKILKRQNEYKRSIKGRYNQAKSVANRRNIIWDIHFNDYQLLLQSNCYYSDQHSLPETGIGLDRINNNLGYILTNVIPCCSDCNTSRSNKYTVEEWKAMILTLENLRKNQKFSDK